MLLVLVVLELIRKRRLKERYALLWLVTGIVLLVLSLWRSATATIADWFGVETYPPAVLFAVAMFFILLVLLDYSTAISKLVDQNVTLAQRLAILEEKLKERDRVVTPSLLDPLRVARGELASQRGPVAELPADDNRTDAIELFEDLRVGERPGAQPDERRIDQLPRHAPVGEVRNDRQIGADELVRLRPPA